MAAKKNQNKDIKPDKRKIWRCDCGYTVKTEKEPASCKACGRTGTFSPAPAVATK
ncbi:MAG: hypothetical protein JRJ66_01475 [Deltaproteobacteria bacterium]|nr:hypothetical protein [Deltaproteobacteria bacterium]MBW2081684.1 hypothetical protein [Deltaproteobacteria bacterium]MBW2298879.1 hypothetical protein [Deltaproteobacteria bacterium]